MTSPWLRSRDEGWERYFHQGHRRQVKRGLILLQPGERSDSLYYLESGRIAVILNWHDGTEKTVSVIEPGTVFGENSFFQPALINVTIKAERDSVIYSLSRECVERCLMTEPSFTLNLFQSMAQKSWVLVKQIEDLRFRSVEERVAGLLYGLAVDKRSTREGGIPLKLTHSDIANLVGAHRVSVSNTLRALEEAGAISLRPRAVLVRDLGQLFALGFHDGWPTFKSRVRH